MTQATHAVESPYLNSEEPDRTAHFQPSAKGRGRYPPTPAAASPPAEWHANSRWPDDAL